MAGRSIHTALPEPLEPAVDLTRLHPGYEILSVGECVGAPELDWAFTAACSLLKLPIDAAISALLEAIGRLAEADRAWMFEYDTDLVSFRNTHEWSRPGVATFVQDLQDAPVTMFAWLHRHLVAGHAVMVNRVDDLPRSAQALQTEMRRQSDKSILAVPIVHDGRLRAALGFDAVTQYRRWPEAEVKALFRCSELVAAARYGRDANEASAGKPNGKSSPLIYLRGPKGMRGAEPTAIVCLRSSRNNTEILLADGSEIVDARSLGIWSGLLSPASFVKVHRTAIVNLVHVKALGRTDSGNWRIELRHMSGSLPVSRSGRQELRVRLGL